MKTNLEITDKIKEYIYPIATFLSIVLLWQFIVVGFEVPQYIMPTPTDILAVFRDDFANLYTNAVVTFQESLFGFIFSVLLALFIGTVMDFVPIIKKCFYPIMLVSQMIPTITIAPLLIIWFGFGSFPKIIMVMTTCFFPILINFVDGMESIDKDYLNLFKTMKSSKINTFIHLKLPMSLDRLFTGLKIAATYAFVAATVAEWLGGSIGLGVYMVRAKSSYALDKVFASTILVIIFSLIYVMVIDILKKIVLKHKYKGE